MTSTVTATQTRPVTRVALVLGVIAALLWLAGLAIAQNQILQVAVFSVFFASALAMLPERVELEAMVLTKGSF